MEAKGKSIGDLRERATELKRTGQDIRDMRGSDTAKASDKANTVRDNAQNGLPVTGKTGDNQVTMFMDNFNNNHEPRHGGQIARGEYGITSTGPDGNYRADAEVSAYRAQYAYDGLLKYASVVDLSNLKSLFNPPVTINNISQINKNMLADMTDGNIINQTFIYRNNPPLWWFNRHQIKLIFGR